MSAQSVKASGNGHYGHDSRDYMDVGLAMGEAMAGVEPTNNHAERTLRLAVLWRKSSFGNHSQDGCRFTERILTVVQTLRLQQRNVMDYLQQTLAAARAGQPIPALVPSGD